MSETRKKLKIMCRTVDCENGLHCYRVSKSRAARKSQSKHELDDMAVSKASGNGRRAARSLGGVATLSPTVIANADDLIPSRAGRRCTACGAQLVEWERVHQRDIHDVWNTFVSLRTEWIRHHFWHKQLDALAVKYAFRRGRRELQDRVATRIQKSVGKPASELPFDGRQTPFGERPAGPNIIYFAQHATACCCRRCIEEWHNIAREQPLTDEQIQYLCSLAMLYIEERLPSLGNEPRGIPPQATQDHKSLHGS